VVATDRPDVLAVLRATTGNASLLLVNLADTAASVVVQDENLPGMLRGSRLKDLLSGTPDGGGDTPLHVELPPFGVKLLTR
jgi:hypothetical protein